MPSIPTDTDPKSWHRYFAIENNNRAWDLAAKDRTDAEDLQMLDAAHASSYHWSVAGTELHAIRSTMLLARVHTLVGHGDYAVKLATQGRKYFLSHETPAWELAFAHAIYAHAAHVVGDLENHRIAYEEAQAALATVTGEEDRALILETPNRVPAP